MPWSAKQVKVARAVSHGWHPRGSAKGFGKNLADLILNEEKTGKYHKKRKKSK